MTCSKCRGMGRFYKQPFPGAWEVAPCMCEASKNVRELRKLKWEVQHQINLLRIQEARERLGIVAGRESDQTSCENAL